MKNGRLKTKVTLMLFLIGLFACKKEKVENTNDNQSTLKISVNYHVDGIPLVFDTIMYKNNAGNLFSISKAHYYLSGFSLIQSNGNQFYTNQVCYLDARKNEPLILANLPAGSFTGIEFKVGIVPQFNQYGLLDNTADNTNMQWPEVMGGGYHFLKFEGYYLDSTNLKKGFTMHLGTNQQLVNHKNLSIAYSLSKEDTSKLNLYMNLNEWFNHPYSYDLNKDGNYTMSSPDLMNLIKTNGNDVFTISN